MKPTERAALAQAGRKGGLAADRIDRRLAEDLVASGLLTAHDNANIGEWTLLLTRQGRALLEQPIHIREPVHLLGTARMPHPDPQRHGTVPEPERIDPTRAQIQHARKLGEQQRASRRADLEAERKRRRNQRGNLRRAC